MQRLVVLLLGGVFVAASAWAQLPLPPGGQGAPAPGPVQPPPLPPPQPRQQDPLPPPLPVVQYYVEESGRPAGPFTLEQLRQRVVNGQLQRTDLVWKTGLANWVEAKDLGELAFGATPPPVGPEGQIKRFLVGVWQAESTNPATGWSVKTTARYSADGNFSGVQAMSMMGMPPVNMPIQGKWSVTAISDREFLLTLNQTGQIPASVSFQIIDHNTLQNKDDGSFAQRVGQ